MRNILLLCLVFSLTVQAQVSTPEPYFTAQEMPDMLNWYQAPPKEDSDEFIRDVNSYNWGKLQRLNPERAAIIDAAQAAAAYAKLHTSERLLPQMAAARKEFATLKGKFLPFDDEQSIKNDSVYKQAERIVTYADRSITDSNQSALQQFVGTWLPDKPGWHGKIDITTDGKNLYVKMETDEGNMQFGAVEVNKAEPSIEFSYSEEFDGLWFIAHWRESNRPEIMMDINHIQASCGVPTEIHQSGVEATHSVRDWKYSGVLVDDETLVLNYGYMWNFLSPLRDSVFMKSDRYMSALKYRR